MVQYKYISNIIEQRIRDHTYPPFSKIPTQNELADEFGTSRITIKKAIDSLIAKGMLVSTRGSGTFVKSNPLIGEFDFDASNYSGLIATFGTEKNRIRSEIIKFEREFPDLKLQRFLQLGESQPVYNIIRLRKIDGEPFEIEHTFMPIEIIPGINKEVLFQSIYSYIQDTLGLKIGSSHRVIRAFKPDSLDIQYLDCKPDDPVLEVEQIAYLENGIPFEYSRTRRRYNKGGIVVNNQIEL